MIFMAVDYIGGEPHTYNGFTLKYKKENWKFNTGNPSFDHFTLWRFVYRKFGEDMLDHVMGSSSLDHFVFDGGEYERELSDQEMKTSDSIVTGMLS